MKQNEKIVKEVIDDFLERAKARKNYDAIWQINMNFLMGNQYMGVGYGGDVEEEKRQYFWQEREIFNHIAPIYDIRYAKLCKIKPDINVIPSTSDERDKQSARVCKKIYNSVKSKLNIDEIISNGLKWSEVTGTCFYKVIWNADKGLTVGRDEKGNPIKSGEIEISVVSPFEIYPESSTCASLEECQSLIHAKAFSTSQIKKMFGVEVQGQSIYTYALDGISGSLGGLGFNGAGNKIISSKQKDSALVIEKYIKPNSDYPNGRLIIVAGDKLVFDGDLPYACGVDGTRDFPFIRQTSTEMAGIFWGTSIIERLVPVQRAFNAVKNREHEFINRLSLGVLSVEDGSVDLDNLQEEGLCPGKVLVYRQGATAPKYLEGEVLPSSLSEEEETLLEEFNSISGVNDLISANSISSSISGTALELLISQDETRLNASVGSLKNAIKKIATFVLRLYKQFASFPRLGRLVGDNGQIEMFYFSSSDITSDDIVLENLTDGVQSISQRREMILSLLNQGLLSDEDGKISNRTKCKILDMLGFGIWDNAQDINELHIKKAENENLKMQDGIRCEVSEIDEHKEHIETHIAFMLGEDFSKAKARNPKLEEIFLEHIRSHKKLKGNEKKEN